LLETLPETLQSEILQVGIAVSDEMVRARFVRDAAPHLRPALVRVALRAARGIRNKTHRWWAMETRLREAKTLNDFEREEALIRLARALPDRLSADALRICASIGDVFSRARTLRGMVPHLPGAMRADAL